jgi:fumarate hydratase subunit alpha/L(+)-tartrate dehydratase alpha subunit
MLRVDPSAIEEAAKQLYIRALKLLPPDVKAGFGALAARETDARATGILGVMVKNIAVAEATDNLLCQDTGIPIYNVVIGRDVAVDGIALKEAIRRGCERATREHPLRSSVVHPVTRRNEHSSCGRGVPVINVDFSDAPDTLAIEMVPKGSGSENNSWLRMAVPAEGVARSSASSSTACSRPAASLPPTIVGVGVGGTADRTCISRVAGTRPLGKILRGSRGAARAEDARREPARRRAAGARRRFDRVRGARRDAATHITMNPVAVNMQCHSAAAPGDLHSRWRQYGFWGGTAAVTGR